MNTALQRLLNRANALVPLKYRATAATLLAVLGVGTIADSDTEKLLGLALYALGGIVDFLVTVFVAERPAPPTTPAPEPTTPATVDE